MTKEYFHFTDGSELEDLAGYYPKGTLFAVVHYAEDGDPSRMFHIGTACVEPDKPGLMVGRTVEFPAHELELKFEGDTPTEADRLNMACLMLGVLAGHWEAEGDRLVAEVDTVTGRLNKAATALTALGGDWKSVLAAMKLEGNRG